MHVLFRLLLRPHQLPRLLLLLQMLFRQCPKLLLLRWPQCGIDIYMGLPLLLPHQGLGVHLVLLLLLFLLHPSGWLLLEIQGGLAQPLYW